MQDLISILEKVPVIPVLTVHDVNHAVPMAKALISGGLNVLEVTLRTPAALEVIERISKEVPDAVVGAGTVLNAKHMEAAAKAGSVFCVSPGWTKDLHLAAQVQNMHLLPGAATASEVMNLLDHGIEFIKFFPAEAAGGIKMLSSFSGPLAQAKFCPTGGISLANAANYLNLPNVVCIGGSWVCPNDALASGDWQKIESLAKEASQIRG